MLDHATTEDKPWQLGSLEEGCEWFAFTFSDQCQIPLTAHEIEVMLAASDQITRQAYSRMLLSDHRWTRHTVVETEQIIKYCKLQRGDSVLDFGCGTGRHAIELARNGLRVTGVDYVNTFVDKANSAAGQSGISARFVEEDCRYVKLDQRFKAALCLYDVVGTYVDLQDNSRIIANLSDHLEPGGYALLSVMNLALTRRRSRHEFSMRSEPNKLLKLPASRIMETTGDIFDPNYYMFDKDNSVVYRREQFTAGQGIPAEIIVRDRRFLEKEIRAMCSEAGLDVVWTRFVSAGRWDDPLNEDDDRAKEILVLCRAPLQS